MRPAVFLDRDGVLCVEKGYLSKASELEVFSYAKNCIDIIHEHGFYAIVVSNQSAVARGILSAFELSLMDCELKSSTGVDAIYNCPFLKNATIKTYRVDSPMRKPAIGMIEAACSDFPIDKSRSIVVGDRATDVILGKNAGMTTVLLESGYGTARMEEKVTPDYIFKNLAEFAESIEVVVG